MNKDKLTAICHKVRDKTGLPFNSVLIYFFMEIILKRLAESKYGEKFVFKGGFLLSNIVGLNTRSTVDIDLLLKNEMLSEENVRKIFSEILTDNHADVITYSIQSVDSIREEDSYGGFRVAILCKLDNIRQVVPLDIATGDIITPEPMTYKYTSVFFNEEFVIKAYTLETILAEKLQTLYVRNFLNSRSKDFYDFYIICKMQKEHLDQRLLLKACENTFRYRGTEFNLSEIEKLLLQLKGSESFAARWNAYAKKNSYVGTTSFSDTAEEILKLLQNMQSEKEEV
jgi:predicted nucleotidyltransferase component of viral defense system